MLEQTKVIIRITRIYAGMDRIERNTNLLDVIRSCLQPFASGFPISPHSLSRSFPVPDIYTTEEALSLDPEKTSALSLDSRPFEKRDIQTSIVLLGTSVYFHRLFRKQSMLF